MNREKKDLNPEQKASKNELIDGLNNQLLPGRLSEKDIDSRLKNVNSSLDALAQSSKLLGVDARGMKLFTLRSLARDIYGYAPETESL